MTIKVKQLKSDYEKVATQIVSQRRDKIQRHVNTIGKTNLSAVAKHFGWGSWQLTLLAVHELVQQGLITGLSPYDSSAPEMDEHILCKL
jgi:hypothetical protein